MNLSSPDVASILARRPETGAIAPIGQMQTLAQPAQAFTWGAGGARKTLEQLAQERSVAAALAQGDYSPVDNWAQGLGRVLDNYTGARDLKRIDQQTADSQAAMQAQLAAALGPENADIASLLAGGGAGASIADNIYSNRNPKPAAPHYFQDNQGNEWAVGPDGRPRVVHEDKTPRYNFIPDGSGGGNWVPLPVFPLGLEGGDQKSSGANVPYGSPTATPPGSFVVDGKQYWEINGKVYDNPEGL